MVLMLAMLAQAADCGPASPALLRDVTAQACARAELEVLYLRGLVAARDAAAAGGSPESLAVVHEAMASLERLTLPTRQAAIAIDVLKAAAAAAQGERDEMALFLAQALQVESLQLAAGQPGAPLVTAHEAAGDLWLLVYRFAEARQAFLDAFKTIGPTRRILLGLARAEARLERGPAACPDTQDTCP